MMMMMQGRPGPPPIMQYGGMNPQQHAMIAQQNAMMRNYGGGSVYGGPGMQMPMPMPMQPQMQMMQPQMTMQMPMQPPPQQIPQTQQDKNKPPIKEIKIGKL